MQMNSLTIAAVRSVHSQNTHGNLKMYQNVILKMYQIWLLLSIIEFWTYKDSIHRAVIKQKYDFIEAGIVNIHEYL